MTEIFEVAKYTSFDEVNVEDVDEKVQEIAASYFNNEVRDLTGQGENKNIVGREIMNQIVEMT